MPYKSSLGFAIAFGLSVASLTAAPPSGIYTYQFDVDSIALWDVSGDYHLSPDINDDIPVNFDISVLQDSKGKLYGTGPTTVDIDGETVQGNYTVKGKVLVTAGVSRATATVKVSGSGMIQGLVRSYSLSETFNLEIDSAGLTAVGTGNGSAKAKGLGSGRISEDINALLPEGVDGSWQLDLGVQTTVKKLSGTSTITLSNGRTLNFATGGSYSPTTDFSKVKLNGTGTSAGSKLNLLGLGDGMGLYQVTGKVLGQTISY